MDNDELMFFDESDDISLSKPSNPWKVLIVDDEDSIHQVTHLLLDRFTYEGEPLLLMSAYSESEAKEILKENTDISVVLLDVVMGNDESGLNLVKYIRDDLKNHMIRIVLRTGQPGQAPEKKVIVEYDINDYKLKTELTADKIYVTMVTALRSYRDLMTLEEHKRTLERTIEATKKLYSNRNSKDFIEDINNQFRTVIEGEEKKNMELMSSMIINIIDGEYIVYSAIGEYSGLEGKNANEILEEEILNLLIYVKSNKNYNYNSYYFAGFLEDVDKEGAVFLVKMSRKISDWDKNMINIFYSTVSVAYANIQLSQEVEHTQKELIFALGEVAEARSHEIGHHVKRVSEYSRLFGELLSLSEEEQELLAMASPVHDIGKLTIPDIILNKPGKLNEEEFEAIKNHTLSGYEILKNSNKKILKTAARIALEHHERWNGLGYPYGLKGEDIHLFGRIVAICDVFDALGSDRVYKKAWEMERIIEYIRDERGKQFDPMLVDVFLLNVDKFIEIRKKFI